MAEKEGKTIGLLYLFKKKTKTAAKDMLQFSFLC